MPARIRNASIIAALVVLAYPVATWVTGVLIEKQSATNQQKALAEAPYVVLARHEYHRGMFSATEETTYRLSLPMSAPASGKNPLKSWSLTVHRVIHHGPFPRLRTFALATADADVELPPQVSDSLKGVLGGKSPLELHTRMDWSGGSTTSFVSPAMTLKLENGTAVIWRGLSGSVEVGRGLATWSASLTAPGLTVDQASTHAEVGTLTLTANMRRVYDTLDVGKASLRVTGATIRAAGSDRNVMLKGLTLSTASAQNGDYMDSAVELSADAVEAGTFSASRAGYALSLTHLHGPSLVALTKAARDLQRQALTAGKEEWQAGLRDALREPGMDLLSHDPVIEIPRIGFVTPEGEMRLSAKLSAPGLTREDLQGPALAAVLLQHLKAEADIRIATALLDKLLAANPNRDTFQQQLATLRRQGYVTLEGSQYTAHLTYERGKTLVNGQPFPPVRAR